MERNNRMAGTTSIETTDFQTKVNNTYHHTPRIIAGCWLPKTAHTKKTTKQQQQTKKQINV